MRMASPRLDMLSLHYGSKNLGLSSNSLCMLGLGIFTDWSIETSLPPASEETWEANAGEICAQTIHNQGGIKAVSFHETSSTFPLNRSVKKPAR